MNVLTRINEINNIIFNYLDIKDLISLSCVSKDMNNEVNDIILKYNVCLVVINTLNEIRNKNTEDSETAEHLLLEMYYDMKKYQRFSMY